MPSEHAEDVDLTSFEEIKRCMLEVVEPCWSEKKCSEFNM